MDDPLINRRFFMALAAGAAAAGTLPIGFPTQDDGVTLRLPEPLSDQGTYFIVNTRGRSVQILPFNIALSNGEAIEIEGVAGGKFRVGEIVKVT